MTAPISFPTLQPAQAVSRRGNLDGFAELLASIQDRRAQRQIQRDQLDLETRRTAQSENMDKFQVAQAQRKTDIEDRRLRASDAVDRYVAEALQDPHLSPTKISDIRSRMVKENEKDLSPYLNEAFDAEFGAQQKTLQGVAERQTAERNAHVANATEQDVIDSAKAQLKLQNAQIATSQLQATLIRDTINLDDARRSQITQFMQGGKTLGEAYAAVGRAVPVGADPAMTLTGAGGSGDAARKTAGLATQAQAGNTLIEAAGNRPLGMRADAFRSITGRGGITGAMGRALLNPGLQPEDRQVLQGYQLMGQAWAQHITGATATDQQMQTFVNTIVTFAGDDPATAQQKISMRRLLPQLIQSGMSPVQIVDAMVNEGLKLGMAPDKIKALQAQRQSAAKYAQSPAYRQGIKRGAAAEPDATAPRIDPAIAAGFRAAPPSP